MSEFMDWLEREIALHEAAGDEEIDTSEINPVPEVLKEYTIKTMSHLKAEILGLDFLETKEGSYIMLEANDIPGLDGFPDDTRHAVADGLRRQMAAWWNI